MGQADKAAAGDEKRKNCKGEQDRVAENIK